MRGLFDLVPIIVLFAWLFFRQVQRVFLLTDESEAAMTAMLQENLTGVRVVRAFAREDFERERFAALNADFRDNNEVLIRWMALYWSASDLLCLSLFRLGGCGRGMTTGVERIRGETGMSPFRGNRRATPSY